MGENPDREGLVETPKRVAQMMEEMFEGIQYTNADIADMFGKTFDVDTNQNGNCKRYYLLFSLRTSHGLDV